jgi:hypothetical protein
MMIIGVDYHPSFQTIAFLMEETGECGEQELNRGFLLQARQHGSGQRPSLASCMEAIGRTSSLSRYRGSHCGRKDGQKWMFGAILIAMLVKRYASLFQPAGCDGGMANDRKHLVLFYSYFASNGKPASPGTL